MALSYQDVMTADLSCLTDVSDAWKNMGDRFGELKGNYDKHVKGALGNGNWQGRSFGAHQKRAGVSAFEFGAAKKEAHAVAELLTQAHTELTRLQKAVKDLVSDAQKKDYKVDSKGKATYVGYDKLTPSEKRALVHDPSYPQLLADAKEKAHGWTRKIAKAVKAVDDADQAVKRALISAASDVELDGIGFGGFNAHPETDLEKAGRPAPSDPHTKTDGGGLKGTGSVTATGPDAGTSVSGPGYGMEGFAKAYADLFHVTQQGQLTWGAAKATGLWDVYGGARVSGNLSLTNDGAYASGEASAGARALVEGRVGSDLGSAYGRGWGFAGGAVEGHAGAGADGVDIGGKAFAGAKAGGAVGADAGGVGVGVTGEAWAGEGIEGDLDLWKKDAHGKRHIGFEFGASPIIGGKVGAEIVVDPKKVTDTAGDAVHALGDAAGAVKDGFTSIF